jgi:uncharacterized membrane protein YdjX (TVP38/TMEM64 family)
VTGSPVTGSASNWTRVAALALLAGAVTVAVLLGDRLPGLAAAVAGDGLRGAALFVFAYIAATVALIPGSLLTLAAGAVFGIMEGTALVLLGATAGSTAAFLIARHLARPAVARRLGGLPKLDRIDRAVARDGLRIILLLRLSPLIPFSVLNYGLGLTRIRTRHFVAGSVAMLPGTLLYVYSGSLIGDVARIAGGSPPERGVAHWVLLLAGLLATLAVTLHVSRIARRALDEGGVSSDAP